MSELLQLCAVFGDAHGGVAEKKTPDDDPRLVPAVGREFWAQCFARGYHEVMRGALPRVIDPLHLWQMRVEIEIRTPRVVREGTQRRVLKPRAWYDRINELILLKLFPELRDKLDERKCRQIARAVRRLHRKDQGEHKIYPDGRALLHWIHDHGLQHYLTTGQEDSRAHELLVRCNAPMSCIDGVFTTHRLGASKMRLEFWLRALAQAKLGAHQVVAWGNNAVQDTYCTVAGIPVVILDRDGVQQAYFLRRGKHLRGARFIDHPSKRPKRGPWITFVETPAELQWWLQILLLSSPGRGGGA